MILSEFSYNEVNTHRCAGMSGTALEYPHQALSKRKHTIGRTTDTCSAVLEEVNNTTESGDPSHSPLEQGTSSPPRTRIGQEECDGWWA